MHKKMSIRFKILVPAVIVSILSSATIGYTSYKDMQHSMIEMGVEEAEMAATFAVKTIDGDYIKTLNSDNAYDQQFMEQQEKINTVKEECGIAYLYTLYTDEEKVYYGIDTGEDQEDYGAEFDYSYKDLQSVFNGQVFV